MNVLIWNVRGLNDPIKQKEIVSRIRNNNINLVCLLETRIKESKMKAVISRHFQGWQMLHNYSEGAPNGRIWILWNEAQVDLVDVMDQCITCSVTIGFQRFNLSVVYASNDGGERKRLWSHLLTAQNENAQYPWLTAGDFNVTAHVSESSNRSEEHTSELQSLV